MVQRSNPGLPRPIDAQVLFVLICVYTGKEVVE